MPHFTCTIRSACSVTAECPRIASQPIVCVPVCMRVGAHVCTCMGVRVCACMCVCRGIGFPFQKSNIPLEVSANSRFFERNPFQKN